MNRDIKFRGRNKQYGWIIGYLEIITVGMGPQKAIIHSFSDWNLNMSTEVDIETVGEYTNLKDKNEKEIWEGDILSQMIETPDGFRKIVGVMEWNKDLAQFGLFLETKDYDPLAGKHFEVKESVSGRPEVVGNIHDNPELLK